MRKVLGVLVLAALAVSAQDIAGEWLDRTGGTVLVLEEDGGYRWAGSEGNFWIEKGSIMFRDALSGKIASFALGFAGDVMQFTDYWMGGRIVLVRKGSPAEGLPLEVILEDLESVSPELASKDGFILREEETRTAFEMLEFITAVPLSEEDASDILNDWLEAFEADPAKVKSWMGELAGMRDHLYRIANPWEVAGFYLRFLADSYVEPEEDVPGDFNLTVMERIDFLVYDTEEKIWLTDRSVDAYLDYACFLTGLVEGKAVKLPGGDFRDSLSWVVAEEFAGRAAGEREFIAAAPVLCAYFGYAWNQASAEERAAIARVILGELAPSGVDFAKLAYAAAAGAQAMDGAALETLDQVLALDHVAAMKRLMDGRDWPYYYEINAP